MRIGNFETKNNIFLAPMAGVTDLSFRRICARYGAGMTYSEMVSAKGLWYKDKKTASLMRIAPDERPTAIQIFGSEPDIMAAVIPQVMEFNPDIIDVNMGCPAPKIVNNGDGSALMKNPKLMGRIVRAVSDVSPVPVTVKFRKGWDSDSVNALECAKILEANGASAVTVHGRTRQQFYSGNADWEIIKEIKKALSIPVIGNGDIWSAEDAGAMLDYTGCDAVMIARGAEGNPFIFRQTLELLETGTVSFSPSPADKAKQALEHTRMLVSEKGESRGIKEARKHIAWYIKGLKGASALKSKIFTISEFDILERLLNDYVEQLQ
ncbi:MAG: tRNA dihydrouridine synthase DusB [bacterium]|nr:tRNA dihydrouridine synthase DusB [bacterium]